MRAAVRLLLVLASVDGLAVPKRSLFQRLRNVAASAPPPSAQLTGAEKVQLVQYARKARLQGESDHSPSRTPQAAGPADPSPDPLCIPSPSLCDVQGLMRTRIRK
jgi:hypothetical protein